MVVLLLSIMVGFLILGFPMLLSMIIAPLAVLLNYFPNIKPELLIQMLISGVSPFVLLAVPMFIFAADIMSKGQMADRLLNLVKSFVGHIHGGLAITAGGTCTIFGAISGSTQATLVAIGKPMFKPMFQAGYNVSHVIALLMNNANLALLIPPSICMIMYCVVTGVSVGELFMAGFAPGLLLFAAFASYDYFYARYKKIKTTRKATWKERLIAFKKAILPLGFPALVLGGIYTGKFSPTEAAAASALYATILEVFIYKSLKFKDFPKIALSTGLVTASVFILIAGGQAFSWVITYAQIPQMLTAGVLGADPSALRVLVMISLFFFVSCMFVDSIPVIIILTPIFYPVAIKAGVDPIHLGIIVTLQSAIGCVTPPFGCNIFTACGIFNKPFLTVVRGLFPYMLINIIMAIIFVLFPAITLLSRNLLY
ncbi:MAG: TRAP transporter large permease [Clostridiales bacterium]